MAVAPLPELGSLRVAGYATAVAVPMMLAVGTDRGSGQRSTGTHIREAALIGYLAVAAASGGFVLIDRAVARIATARAGLLAGLVPVGAIAAGPGCAHKATPTTASSPHGSAPAQRDYIPPIGLWQRLAESPGLSPEGRRQIATARGSQSRDVALVLLARPDLDEEARQQVLKADGYAIPEALVTSGRLTSAEIAALIDRHPDSGDLYQAALCSLAGKAAAQRKIASLSSAEAAHVWIYSHIPSKKRPELAAELLPVILASPADSPSDEAPSDTRYERSSVIQSMASSLPPEQRLEFLRSPVYGRLLQQAFLDDKTRAPLSVEELVACVPEITRPQKHLPAEPPVHSVASIEPLQAPPQDGCRLTRLPSIATVLRNVSCAAACHRLSPASGVVGIVYRWNPLSGSLGAGVWKSSNHSSRSPGFATPRLLR